MRGGGISINMSVAAALPWLVLVTAAGRPAHRTTSPPPLPTVEPAPLREPRDTALLLLPLDTLRLLRSDERVSKLSTLSEQRHDLGSVSLAQRRGLNSLHLSLDWNTIS